MQKEERVVRFFKPECPIDGALETLAYLSTESFIAGAFAEMVSCFLGTLVHNAIPNLPGDIWICRASAGSQTAFSVQYSIPKLGCGPIATADLATKTITFDGLTRTKLFDEKVVPFLKKWFRDLKWQVKDY